MKNELESEIATIGKMLELYCEGMHAGDPVHTWEIP